MLGSLEQKTISIANKLFEPIPEDDEGDDAQFPTENLSLNESNKISNQNSLHFDDNDEYNLPISLKNQNLIKNQISDLLISPHNEAKETIDSSNLNSTSNSLNTTNPLNKTGDSDIISESLSVISSQKVSELQSEIEKTTESNETNQQINKPDLFDLQFTGKKKEEDSDNRHNSTSDSPKNDQLQSTISTLDKFSNKSGSSSRLKLPQISPRSSNSSPKNSGRSPELNSEDEKVQSNVLGDLIERPVAALSGLLPQSAEPTEIQRENEQIKTSSNSDNDMNQQGNQNEMNKPSENEIDSNKESNKKNSENEKAHKDDETNSNDHKEINSENEKVDNENEANSTDHKEIKSENEKVSNDEPIDSHNSEVNKQNENSIIQSSLKETEINSQEVNEDDQNQDGVDSKQVEEGLLVSDLHISTKIEYSKEQLDSVLDKFIATKAKSFSSISPDMRKPLFEHIARERVTAIEEQNYDRGEKLINAQENLRKLMLKDLNDNNEMTEDELNKSRLFEAKQQLKAITIKWDKQIKELESRLKDEESLLLDNQRQEMQSFSDFWSDPSQFHEFNKASAILLQTREQEKNFALMGDFQSAKMMKKRSEQLEKAETLAAQKKAETVMKLKYEQLRQKHLLQLDGHRRNCHKLLKQLEIQKEMELQPYRMAIRKYENIQRIKLESSRDKKVKIRSPPVSKSCLVIRKMKKDNLFVVDDRPPQATPRTVKRLAEIREKTKSDQLVLNKVETKNVFKKNRNIKVEKKQAETPRKKNF